MPTHFFGVYSTLPFAQTNGALYTSLHFAGNFSTKIWWKLAAPSLFLSNRCGPTLIVLLLAAAIGAVDEAVDGTADTVDGAAWHQSKI